MIIRKIFFTAALITTWNAINAQGCSDAGFCTAGNFNAIHTGENTPTKTTNYKNEMDVAFIYGTHNKGTEQFYQPQLNYRRIKTNGSFFEIRLPFSIVKYKTTSATTNGIGDITATYNNAFSLNKKHRIQYAIGFRASLTHADKVDPKSMESYPMFLQNGLGTTDLIAVVNYDIVKYISVGTGIQMPLIQYNQNKIYIQPLLIGSLSGDGYRRKPDALLKLTGHYQINKFKINAGLLSIFHLANDYYNTSSGKFILQDSKGTTINLTADFSYAFSDKWMFNVLYAEPLQTRKNIPDGLARSRIIVPKITFAF